jgi:hypothetical protein
MKAAVIGCICKVLAVKVVQKNGEIVGSVTSRQPALSGTTRNIWAKGCNLSVESSGLILLTQLKISIIRPLNRSNDLTLILNGSGMRFDIYNTVCAVNIICQDLLNNCNWPYTKSQILSHDMCQIFCVINIVTTTLTSWQYIRVKYFCIVYGLFWVAPLVDVAIGFSDSTFELHVLILSASGRNFSILSLFFWPRYYQALY